MSAPTPGEIDLMRHALGVYTCDGRRWKKPYRNYYCAGDDAVSAWESLVTAGLAVKTSDGKPLTGGCPVYRVTDEGQRVALAAFVFKRRWGYPTREALARAVAS